MRPGSARTIGAPLNTGAVATMPIGTLTRLDCTGLRAMNVALETAEIPPGALQLA